MAVLDIRGTHGSGKSWIVHQLLEHHHVQPILEENKQIGYSLSDLDAAIVGRYKNVCGGCDGVGSADEIVRRVRLFNSMYKCVIIEGILVSHTFRRYSSLAEEIGDYTFLFLNTPLRNCIARTRGRRRRAGNTKPLNPVNIVSNWYGVWQRVRTKCLEANHRVVILPWQDPMPVVHKELNRVN